MASLDLSWLWPWGPYPFGFKRFYYNDTWTFPNQNDRAAYLGTLVRTWIAQLIIISVLFVGTVLMQKR